MVGIIILNGANKQTYNYGDTTLYSHSSDAKTYSTEYGASSIQEWGKNSGFEIWKVRGTFSRRHIIPLSGLRPHVDRKFVRDWGNSC